jgi:pantoate--beta-alanine ligase
MTADLDFGIEIVGVPTVREVDGLAVSSRNRLLGEAARAAARCAPEALAAAAERVRAGETDAARIRGAALAALEAEPLTRVEYAECRDPHTLDEVTVVEQPTLLAICVWIDGVRLIDNRVLTPGRTGHDS